MTSLIEDDNADSSQIGTLLMVAITVCLAAVILVFSAGTAHEVEAKYTVAVSVKALPNNHVILTYHGGPDDNFLERLDWEIYNRERAKAGDSDYNIRWVDNPSIGWSADIIELDLKDPHTIIVVGTFTGNDKIVLLNEQI